MGIIGGGGLSKQVSDGIHWVFIAMFYAIYDHRTVLKYWFNIHATYFCIPLRLAVKCHFTIGARADKIIVRPKEFLERSDKLTVRQCKWTCGACANMRSDVQMLVRIRGGINTTRFRRFSVDLVKWKIRCRSRRTEMQQHPLSIVVWNRDAFTRCIW